MRISDWSSDVCSSDLSFGFSFSKMASSSFFSASDKSFSAAGNIPSSSSSIWWMYRSFIVRKRVGQPVEAHLVEFGRQFAVAIMIGLRSEERRDGKEGVRRCRSWGATYHKKKK